MFSWPEVVVIGTVALVFFGPKRLPEMAKSIGEGIKEFRKATQEGLQGLQDPPAAPKTCAACRQAITDPASRFCARCGQAVPAAPSSPAA